MSQTYATKTLKRSDMAKKKANKKTKKKAEYQRPPLATAPDEDEYDENEIPLPPLSRFILYRVMTVVTIHYVYWDDETGIHEYIKSQLNLYMPNLGRKICTSEDDETIGVLDYVIAWIYYKMSSQNSGNSTAKTVTDATEEDGAGSATATPK
ncbi:hypothetical protein EV175_002460 [Coemansia sp. RSA 1933]|nr:hypothetical protein EV175_002460 [Coemansia sp. RSA 1933]